MDDRWLNHSPQTTSVKRRYGTHGPKYVDVEDFLEHEFQKVSKMEFPPETVNGYQRQFIFTLLLKEADYAVFNVNMNMIREGNESNYEAKVFLTIRPWDGMEDVLGSDPFTVQIEGKSNVLKQLNPSTYAFSKFFGLCHCDVLTD